MITLSQVTTAASGTAWKTTTMRGYLFKTALDAEIYGRGAFTLTFREADDHNGNPVDYVFYYNVDAETLEAYNTEHGTSYAATDSTALKLLKELLGHVLTAQWQTGTAADYEMVRDGGDRTW